MYGFIREHLPPHLPAVYNNDQRQMDLYNLLNALNIRLPFVFTTQNKHLLNRHKMAILKASGRAGSLDDASESSGNDSGDTTTTHMVNDTTDSGTTSGTTEIEKRKLKDLVNTPLKKVMFGIQILSYILIVGSPAIGGYLGKLLDLTKGQTAGLILGVFIAGEVLFYGSLAFLGRELILLLRDRFKRWFSRKKRKR